MTDEPKTLNPRETRFAHEYVQDLNGTQAAIRAGYSAKTARTKASQLLAKVGVKALVDSLIDGMHVAKIMTANEALAEASKLARGSVRRFVHITQDGDPYTDLNQAEPDDLDAIAELTIEDFTDGREVDAEGNTIKREVRRVKTKMHNKVAALGLVMKYHGLLVDKVEHDVSSDFAAKMAAAMQRARPAEGDGNDG